MKQQDNERWNEQGKAGSTTPPNKCSGKLFDQFFAVLDILALV